METKNTGTLLICPENLNYANRLAWEYDMMIRVWSLIIMAALIGSTVDAREKFTFAKQKRAETKMVVDGFLYVDTEDFDDYGGWRMDTQFVHLMGSPFLMATGIGKPVEDATTTISVPKTGDYNIWVRARNWVKEHKPGRFKVLVGGKALEKEFGAADTDKWTWEKGGKLSLKKGDFRLSLHDLTGFYGRCDAILLTTDANYIPQEDKEGVCKERARLQGLSLEPKLAGAFDVIVVGGGSAGVSAAIAAARNGEKTALIQNRPVLGGNCSVEAGVGVNGAGGNHPGWREAGIIEEAGWITASEKQINYSLAFKKLCDEEENLTLFLNQHVFEAVMDGKSRIKGVKSVSTLTGMITEYQGTIFIDCSGDGWLGYYAGAEYRHGREASSEFKEKLAPKVADKITMSGCIMGDGNGYMTAFRSKKTEQPVKFVLPAWVKPIDTLESPKGTKRGNRLLKGKVPNVGTWWMEHPGDIDDAMQAEEARDELIKVSLAFWDYVKNRSDVVAKARNYELVMIPILDAKRESRRLKGDYMVNQNDVESARLFDDRIAYAGWDLDIHHPEGIYSGKKGALDFKHNVPLNSVPLRSIYSKNIDNLLMAGRCLSYSHVALGTVRVQSTLATVGQAAGTAAAICVDRKINPRTLGKKYIAELQQELLKDDQTIQGIRNEDSNDLARNATVTASSFDPATEVKVKRGKRMIKAKRNFKPENIINGWTRLAENTASMWRSNPAKSLPQSVELDFGKPTAFNTVQLTFVTHPSGQRPKLPFSPTCVRDYDLEVLVDGKWVPVVQEKGNFQRHRVHSFETKTAMKLRITVRATHGDKSASIFEVRVYKEESE